MHKNNNHWEDKYQMAKIIVRSRERALKYIIYAFKQCVNT